MSCILQCKKENRTGLWLRNMQCTDHAPARSDLHVHMHVAGRQSQIPQPAPTSQTLTAAPLLASRALELLASRWMVAPWGSMPRGLRILLCTPHSKLPVDAHGCSTELAVTCCSEGERKMTPGTSRIAVLSPRHTAHTHKESLPKQRPQPRQASHSRTRPFPVCQLHECLHCVALRWIL